MAKDTDGKGGGVAVSRISRGLLLLFGAGVLLALAFGLNRLAPLLSDDRTKGITLAACLIAVAFTPIAFGILGRIDWFQARRGRVYQRPEFFSVVCGMLLVMGVPAILAGIVIKSDQFDKNRYEFDPNKIPTVLEQGRQYRTAEEMNAAIRAEMDRLALERKNLVDTVKKLDESMLTLLAAAKQAPPAAQAMPSVLERLAAVRRSVGLDGPQQLMDFTAPPAELRTLTASAAPGMSTPVAPAAVAVAAPVATPGALPKPLVDAELAGVPDPQKKIAAMLPLLDLPAGWVVGKSGDKHLETFNAENLFEKIDGRAESFIQYDVKGMAYTYFHPVGDESNEVQLYVFEMANPLKALGKYGSEKPEGVTQVEVGTEGYTSAGSTLFHAGPFYTQIVSTKDDARFTEFAIAIARRVAALQQPAGEIGGAKPSESAFSTPDRLFALLPAKPDRKPPKYVAQDVFGYSFLSDVFMADYDDGGVTWQGFLRPYSSPEAAEKIFQSYLETVKKDGAKIETAEVQGADRFVVSDNIGLIDVLFRRGNIIGGANGSTDRGKAENFVKSMLSQLPPTLPPLESDGAANAKASAPPAEGAEGGESNR
ncbi:MAG: DUF6599 family protein [Isosphaeraceae bacterium]|nr:DUF6599 family protein [Isosphaeraceae bacterium]